MPPSPSLAATHATWLWAGDALTAHRMPGGHPNAIDRQTVFFNAAKREVLLDGLRLGAPRLATREELFSRVAMSPQPQTHRGFRRSYKRPAPTKGQPAPRPILSAPPL